MVRRALPAAALAATLVLGSALPAAAESGDRTAPSTQIAVPTDPPATDVVLGEVVVTGAGEWLIYAVPLVVDANPRTRFGVALGLPGPVTVVLTNESSGSDRSAGFHAVQGAAKVGTRRTLTFGYYAGPAARIQGTDRRRHRTVRALRATWSEDPAVVFFWFPAGTGPLEKLVALDRSGRRLPAGDPRIGVG